MEARYQYQSFRNFNLIHLYQYKIYKGGRTSVSRTTYRINEKDKKLREINDLTGFGCTCRSLKEAERYVKTHEKWKDSADDQFNIITGEPINKGVRNEFLSENKHKGASCKAAADSESSIIWRLEDFRPLRPNS